MLKEEIREKLPVWAIQVAYDKELDLREWHLEKVTAKTAVLIQGDEKRTLYKRDAWK
jgi:hypothetical protein